MTLEVSNLTGGYGQLNVLHDVSFTIGAGELVALVGLNGSGKSTTINHVIGLLQPHQGVIKLNGVSLMEQPVLYKENLAYVPEQPILYDELTLREHIEATVAAYHLDEEEAWQRAEKLLQMFRLDNKLDWFPAHFSKGMRQKVMIVMAFMTEAPLLIIDEPFIGLDVLAVQDILALLAERKAAGGSILLTTHSVEMVQDLIDRFVYLENGTVAEMGAGQDFAQLVPALNVKKGEA